MTELNETDSHEYSQQIEINLLTTTRMYARAQSICAFPPLHKNTITGNQSEALVQKYGRALLII